MTIITIPKHLANKDLVLIPRAEYEAMLRVQPRRGFKEGSMTKAPKRELGKTRKTY